MDKTKKSKVEFDNCNGCGSYGRLQELEFGMYCRHCFNHERREFKLRRL